MKRIILAAFVACLVFISGSANVSALSVSGPHPPGPVINGWYKDTLTATISGQCSGSSTTYNFDYSSNASGTHTWSFYTDENGSPYVRIDSNGYSPLNSQPCGFSLKYLIGTGMTAAGSFRASVDSQPPSVTINTGDASTTDSTYDINGAVSDPEGNLSSVKSILNGSTGANPTVNGTSYNVVLPLKVGTNTIQMAAYDSVGHSSTSNTVTITRTIPVSNTSSSSSSSSASKNNSAAPAANSSPDDQVQFSPQQVINIDDPYADQVNSSPADVQASASLDGISGPIYWVLVGLLIILSALCLFIMNKFRPIFSKLKNKSGLRKRIIVVVALPSIIPLLGLGLLGYQQLSNVVKSSLSDQLDKASQTSALKLQREFGMRSVVITKTSSDILQIQNQYKSQIDQLAQQKNNCQQLVKAAVPAGQLNKVTSNADCLPFLSGFAQVATVSSRNVNSYIDALNKGANNANSNLIALETERVNELLNSLRSYFPDLLEVDIVDATPQANVQAVLPNSNPNQPTISDKHSDLLTVASSKKVIVAQTSDKSQQLLLTYPVLSGTKVIGGVVIALDTGNFAFIPSIWQSTPKPYATDQVFFVTSAGDIIAPRSSPDKQLQSQVKPLAMNPAGKVFNLNIGGETLATRTTTVPNTNLVVAVGAPASSVLAPLAGIQLTAILAIVAFILLSVLLGIWFVSGIAGEIDKLFLGAQNYSKGDLDYHIALESGDELQMLGDTMNQMAADIKTAQAALIQKDKEFISIATHELKAPMTAIIGFLSMIVDDGMGQVDETARKFIKEAYSGTTRLRDLVTDLLDIARLESGHAQFTLEPLAADEMAQMVIDMQKLPAEQAGITLIHQGDTKPPKVIADKNKLQIIMTNFVSNAIKYNRKGGSVTIAHEIKDGQLVTSVTDTGLGIPTDQQGHIFEKFYRVQNKDRTNVPGTGLGMYITKQFIENMGGKVWFESVHGKGTTFYFSLPLEQSAQAHP